MFCSYLWYFVSKFTEYDAKKLHKVYRKAVKKDKDRDSKSDKSKDKDKGKDKPEEKAKGEKKDKDKEKHKKEKKDKERKSNRREKEQQKTNNQSVYHENSNSSHADMYRGGDINHIKPKIRDREQPNQSSFHENSNSSLGDSYRDHKSKMIHNNQYREERERERSVRDPRDRMDRGRYENERVPPTNYDNSDQFSNAPGSSFNPSPRIHPPLLNGPAAYPTQDSFPYRDRERVRAAPGDPRGDSRGVGGDPRGDPRRDRSSGDPRNNRMGRQSNKGYFNNYERDRRGENSPGNNAGRPWQGHQENKRH